MKISLVLTAYLKANVKNLVGFSDISMMDNLVNSVNEV